MVRPTSASTSSEQLLMARVKSPLVMQMEKPPLKNTYIHTYTHTYIHTYIHTYVHTYIHSYIRKECKGQSQTSSTLVQLFGSQSKEAKTQRAMTPSQHRAHHTRPRPRLRQRPKCSAAAPQGMTPSLHESAEEEDGTDDPTVEAYQVDYF